MKIVSRPSPNYNARPAGVDVDCLLLHATESSDTKEDLAWLCKPKSADHPNPTSAHVLIDRDGTVYDLVPIARRAWHAGESSFMGRPDVNDFSIGMEFANRCDGKEPFTDAQYRVGALLAADFMAKCPKLTIERITRHQDVALPRGRKPDPGPKFDIPRFLTLVQAARVELAAEACVDGGLL